MANPTVTTDVLKLCTYNMHGYNNGRPLLEHLCSAYDVILLQEHWLPPGDLNKLNSINDEFNSFSVSSMEEKLSSGILVGRPFGGVAVLWKKHLSNYIKIIDRDDRGRYIAFLFSHNNCNFLIHCVYFPCSASSNEFVIDCSNLIAKIELNLINHSTINWRGTTILCAMMVYQGMIYLKVLSHVTI